MPRFGRNTLFYSFFEKLGNFTLAVSRYLEFIREYINIGFVSNLQKCLIIIFAYNHADYIEECVKSVIEQQEVLVRVIVIDDFSQDGTRDRLIDLQKSNPNQIELIFNDINCGSVKESLKYNLNRIQRHCDFFVILEGDDYFSYNRRLIEQSKLMNAHKDIIGVASCCKLINQLDGTWTFIKPDVTEWNYYDLVQNAKKYKHYVHMSSILWRAHKSIFPAPKRYLAGIESRGEIFFVFSALRKTKMKMVYLDIPASVYRYSGKGAWSSLSKVEQDRQNHLLEVSLYSLLPLRFRFRILRFFTKFYRTSKAINN